MPGRSMPSGTTARERFTGHERDEEVGLDYMKARRYAAEFGRFCGSGTGNHHGCQNERIRPDSLKKANRSVLILHGIFGF